MVCRVLVCWRVPLRQALVLGWNAASADPGKDKLLGTWLHFFVPQRDLCDVAYRVVLLVLLHRRAAPHDFSPVQQYRLTQKVIHDPVENGFASHLCLQVAAVERR